MRERSETVRVFTHPATWKNRNFVTSRSDTFRLMPAADTRFPPRSLCGNHHPPFRSIPRTCTVRRDSEYSISSDVIQRVICKVISRGAAYSSPCEIA